jgi:undecaprenyl-diphosphatase
MEPWQAFVLGLVEGLTEYLPVSSTGHLLLAERALGLEATANANAYAICIQAGAVAAVLGLYFSRAKQIARGLRGADPVGRTLACALAAAFLPAAIVGPLCDDHIERRLFGLWPVVAAWLAGGIAILAVARRRRGLLPPGGSDLERLSVRGAFLIGLAQCVAMWPGTSRSLVTIVAGVLVGLNLAAAVEFSFLLGVATLFAATVYKSRSQGAAMLADFGALNIAIGFLAAFLSAVVSVRWMVGYLHRHGLEIFGYWRIAAALVVGALILAGTIEPS